MRTGPLSDYLIVDQPWNNSSILKAQRLVGFGVGSGHQLLILELSHIRSSAMKVHELYIGTAAHLHDDPLNASF